MNTRIMAVALVVVSTCVVAILIAGIVYAGDPPHGNVYTSGGTAPIRNVIRRRELRTPSRALETPEQTKPGGQRFRMGADSFGSGFEPPCTLDYIGGGGSGVPQNCEWHASNNVNDNPPPTQPIIDNSNPFVGEQHLHLEFDPAQPSGPAARNWAFSDNIANPPVDGVMTLELMLYINEPGGLNEYRVRPQAPSQRMATAEMLFMPSGEIVCFEDLDPNDGEFDGFVTEFTWVPGEYKAVSICVDNVNNRIRYFYDEDLVWSTGVGEGGQGTGVFGATTIEHVLIRYEDNQNDTTFMDVDEVFIESDNCRDSCPADLDGDGAVGAADLAELLGSWGPCKGCPADLDGNGQVGPFDLALLLGNWGPCE